MFLFFFFFIVLPFGSERQWTDWLSFHFSPWRHIYFTMTLVLCYVFHASFFVLEPHLLKKIWLIFFLLFFFIGEMVTIHVDMPRIALQSLFPGAGYDIKVFAISHGLWSEPHVYFQAVCKYKYIYINIRPKHYSKLLRYLRERTRGRCYTWMIFCHFA